MKTINHIGIRVLIIKKYAPLAQLVEQHTHNVEVTGSTPVGRTREFDSLAVRTPVGEMDDTRNARVSRILREALVRIQQ